MYLCNITPCSPHVPMYSPTSWPLPHGITSSFAYFESIQKYLSVGIYFIDQMLAFVRNHTMFSSSPPHFPLFLSFQQAESLHSLHIRNLLNNTYLLIYIS